MSESTVVGPYNVYHPAAKHGLSIAFIDLLLVFLEETKSLTSTEHSRSVRGQEGELLSSRLSGLLQVLRERKLSKINVYRFESLEDWKKVQTRWPSSRPTCATIIFATWEDSMHGNKWGQDEVHIPEKLWKEFRPILPSEIFYGLELGT